jgi:hypothetical protein
MNTTSMPSFTAETSLYKTNETYMRRSRSSAVAADTGIVYPALPLCWGGMCMCAGDEDCNTMFSSGCNGGYAQCWIRGPGDSNVFCMCN